MGTTEVVAMFQFLTVGPIVATDTRVCSNHLRIKRVDGHRPIYPGEPLSIFGAVSTVPSALGNVDNRSCADKPAVDDAGRPA
jgi:hypothetical protein